MRARRAYLELSYTGEWTDFTYTDPAEGEADEIEISIFDRNESHKVETSPSLGDTITAKIRTVNWAPAPGGGTLDCGSFIVDDYSYSGWPISGTIKAVSTPADSSFRETEKSKVWKKVTLEEMGKEIAGSASVELSWNVESAPPAMESVEQSNKTDCSFYQEKCEEYGLCLKLYKEKLVVYDREAYKKKDPVAVISQKDVQSWTWKKTLAHTYTGGVYTYTSPKTKKKVKVTVGDGTRILRESGKADSQADAELKMKAAINNANHNATAMTCEMMGRTDLVATQCVTMTGFGSVIDGKYYIDKATHAVSASSGFTTSLEMSKVEEEESE